MTNTRSKFIAVFFASIVGQVVIAENLNTANINQQPKCAALPSDLDQQFYAKLQDLNKVSQKNIPVENAFEFLKQIQSQCMPLSPEQASHLLDLNGEASRAGYMYSGLQKFFDAAELSYQNALSLNSARSEEIYWHLALLMQFAGKHDEGIKYINNILNMKPLPKDPVKYLLTAFELAVDAEQWNNAYHLMAGVQKYVEYFYTDVKYLSPSVVTLCHVNKSDVARQIIKIVEDNVPTSDNVKTAIQNSKDALQACEKNVTKV